MQFSEQYFPSELVRKCEFGIWNSSQFNLLFATHFFVKLHVFIHGCLMVWPDLYFFLLSYKTQKVVLCEKSDLHETGPVEPGGAMGVMSAPPPLALLMHTDLDGPIVSQKLPLHQNGLQLNRKCLEFIVRYTPCLLLSTF